MIKNILEASEEQLLSVYLNSRGINPKFVTKDTKISHAKSAEFAKWKADHQDDRRFNEANTIQESDKSDVISVDIPLMIRLLEYAREDAKTDMDLHFTTERLIEIRNKGTLTMADYDYIVGAKKKIKEGFDDYKSIAKELVKRHGKDVTKQHIKDIEGERDTRGALDHDEVMAHVKKLNEAQKPTKMTSLDKFRKAADERAKKHADIEKQSKEKPDMKGAIDRLEKHLNKEEVELEESSKDELKSLAANHGWSYKRNTYGAELHHAKHGSIGMDRYGHWYHHPEGKSGPIKHQGEYNELGKHLSSLKEEVEQIDELKKSTVKSWLSQQKVVPDKKPGMDRKAHNRRIKTRSKSWDRALDRLSGHKPTSEETVSEVFSTGVQGHVSQAALDSIKGKRNVQVNLGTPTYKPKPKTLAKKPSKRASFLSKIFNKEDTHQDSYAATQTTGMEITDLPAEDKIKRKEMSKSARMIKSIYKKLNMKEELYDHEKEDKSVATYGKKPTMVKAEKKLGLGENQPQAAAVLSGGKTLTGQTRDTLEIDPLMRKPGPPIDQNKKV